MQAIVQITYDVFIKGIETPINLSKKWWDELIKSLKHKDCPPFLEIWEDLYNRFEISSVRLHKDEISPERQQALREHEEIMRLMQEKEREEQESWEDLPF